MRSKVVELMHLENITSQLCKALKLEHVVIKWLSMLAPKVISTLSHHNEGGGDRKDLLRLVRGAGTEIMYRLNESFPYWLHSPELQEGMVQCSCPYRGTDLPSNALTRGPRVRRS